MTDEDHCYVGEHIYIERVSGLLWEEGDEIDDFVPVQKMNTSRT